ncbi:hypothetical protein [Tuwongella immobilis]|uniref:hypothetical protein n=1 Tax=Tuwongella immobilis TaxID=692036 RepID=UPI0036F21729
MEFVFERSPLIFELRVAGQFIETTAEHPFWVVGRSWTPVWELSIADSLTTITKETVSVEDVHETDRRETVDNLRVSDFHTDAVGCDEWGCSGGASCGRLLDQPCRFAGLFFCSGLKITSLSPAIRRCWPTTRC